MGYQNLFYTSAFLVIFVLWETARFIIHIDRRKKIRTVINVNGTRGKSSVARLLCFALKEAGYRVMAKTTGTIPQIVSVDGSVTEIKRGAYANINEQVKTIKEAARQGAEILVVECMAIDPNYQEITESRMLRSDIGVITNVRTDHREVMGARLPDIAKAMCGTIPRNRTVFTAEKDHFDIIEEEAVRKKARAVRVRDASAISDDMMRPFPFLEQRENVALVLDVCNYMGLSDETALAGMYRTIPDPGVLHSFRFERDGRHFEIVNAFSANDPDSLKLLWERMSRQFLPGQKKILLFNSRPDRPVRSVDTARAFADWPVDLFLITGRSGLLFRRTLLRSGVSRERAVYLGMMKAEKIFERCLREAGDRNFIFCAGNIKDRGMEFIAHVEKISQEEKKKGQP